MLTIEYNELDASVSIADGLARQEANRVIDLYLKDSSMNYCLYSSEVVILAFRECVALNKISRKDIQFKYKGEFMKMDRDLMLNRLPKGFCDTIHELYMQLLKSRCDDRR